MPLEGCMLTDTHSAPGDGAIRGALESEFEKPCSVMEEGKDTSPTEPGEGLDCGLCSEESGPG